MKGTYWGLREPDVSAGQRSGQRGAACYLALPSCAPESGVG